MQTEAMTAPAPTGDTFPSMARTTSSFGSETPNRPASSTARPSDSSWWGIGPETGVRDRASYLLQQEKIRFVLTTPIRPDLSDEARVVADHIYRHGDGVRDLALWVDDAREAYARAIERAQSLRKSRRS